jgi:hypothetical protein
MLHALCPMLTSHIAHPKSPCPLCLEPCASRQTLNIEK